MTADEVPNVGVLLFVPYRFMESAVLAELRVHGHDLSLSQARVFQRIDPGGSRMSELAAAAELSKQTLSSIVDQLERRGYVRRTADPVDARGRIVSLTARGRELVELGRPVIGRIEKEWESHLGERRMQQLRGLLADLASITDPYARPPERDGA